MKRFSEVQKRITAGAAFVLFAACAANYYGQFGWFGKYGLDVLIGGILLSLLLAVYLGPHEQLGGERKDRRKDE